MSKRGYSKAREAMMVGSSSAHPKIPRERIKSLEGGVLLGIFSPWVFYE
jgi:hypothetical protein